MVPSVDELAGLIELDHAAVLASEIPLGIEACGLASMRRRYLHRGMLAGSSPQLLWCGKLGCPVSIATPSRVRMIPLFDSNPLCERDFGAAETRVKEVDTP
jgi:hypothetical protein